MKKFEKYVQDIGQHFPDLRIFSIKKTGEGDNSEAFLINHQYIFRFAKREEVIRQMGREIVALPVIRSATDLGVPEFTWISPKKNFVGYPKIPGEILTGNSYRSFTEKQQVHIQQSLAEFLSQLHFIRFAELEDCLETMDPRQEYTDNFEKARQFIYPLLGKEKQDIITRFFTGYLRDEHHFGYRPALIHNDFSSDHILFDPGNRKITGIIDFGDIAFGDPDYDLMYLLDEFGEGFIKKFFAGSPREIPLQKLYFFSLANKIQIVLESIQDGAENDSRSAMAKLDRWLARDHSKNRP